LSSPLKPLRQTVHIPPQFGAEGGHPLTRKPTENVLMALEHSSRQNWVENLSFVVVVVK